MHWLKQFNRVQWATLVALIFHLVGLLGILIGNRSCFSSLTVWNLCLMFGLLVFTESAINRKFLLFVILCWLIGIGAEIIGTRTGYLFGHYHYTDTLGVKFMGVPLIIGINWFVVVYAAGNTMEILLTKISEGQTYNAWNKSMKILSLLIDGALLATCFDWLMEPVAVKLDYWKWDSEVIPFYNYLCWFLLSVLLLALFRACKINGQNRFALHLLMIQSSFFLLLRILM